MSGEGARDGLLEEGMYFEIPDESASRIVESSAEIGGPGDGVRRIGASCAENRKFRKDVLNVERNEHTGNDTYIILVLEGI